VLGGSGGIGQPLSMLMKLSHRPAHVSELAVYDVAHAPGVAADLSHIDTDCKVPPPGWNLPSDGFLHTFPLPPLASDLTQ
jgi:hypothetical protein